MWLRIRDAFMYFLVNNIGKVSVVLLLLTLFNISLFLYQEHQERVLFQQSISKEVEGLHKEMKDVRDLDLKFNLALSHQLDLVDMRVSDQSLVLGKLQKQDVKFRIKLDKVAKYVASLKSCPD